MNFSNAKNILNLNNDFSLKDLRRSYYKNALKYHPDKCQLEDGCKKFKEINEAYEYMLKYKNIEDTEKNENGYLSLIKRLIRLVLPKLHINDELLDNTLKNILFKFKKLSLKLFSNVPREDLIELYTFILKNKEIFNHNTIFLERLVELIKSNIDIDNLIILNPSIEDLLNDNVFCLKIKDSELLIPLWHDEIDFDISNCNICVKNIPDLKDNIRIDKLNNIHIEVSVSVNDLLENDYVLKLGRNEFKIPSSELKIIKEQTYTLKRCGMLKINKDDLFDISTRSDINVTIKL